MCLMLSDRPDIDRRLGDKIVEEPVKLEMRKSSLPTHSFQISLNFVLSEMGISPMLIGCLELVETHLDTPGKHPVFIVYRPFITR